MADFKPYKVNSLPTSNIDVDGIYYVKTNNTFKAYIRNQADTDWVEQEVGDTFTFDDLTPAQKEELKGDVIAYNSLSEADKNDLAARVPVNGVVEDGNIQAVSGGEVYKNIDSIFIKGLVKWKPQTTNVNLYDFRDLITSFVFTLTTDFRKPDGNIRKVLIRTLSKSISTLLITINVEIEDDNGSFVQVGAQSTATDSIVYTTPYGNIDITFATTLPPGANNPATYFNSGININLLTRAQYDYNEKYNKNIFSQLESNVAVDISSGYLNSTGVFTNSANWIATTDFITVVQGEPLGYIGNTSVGGAARAVCGYDENENFVDIVLGSVNAQEKMDFLITNPLIKKIKACSFNDTPLAIFKISGGGSIELSKKQMNRSWRAVGMSIWASDETTYRGYQTLIKEQYSFTGYSKYCYSGNSLGGLTAGDTSSVLNKSGWVGTADDIWTLDTITNDFKRDIPIGTIADYNNNTGITTFYGALRVFKDKVDSLSSNATVICSNALRRDNAGYTSTSTNSVGATLLDYEEAVMTIASLNDWYFVDQFRMSGITDETLSITTTDGLHLNNFGYTLAVLPWIPVFETVYLKQF